MSAGSKFQRNLPNGPYQGATNNTTNPPTALNPFATIADLVGALDMNGIYGGNGGNGGNGTTPSNTVATITDNFTFSGGKFIVKGATNLNTEINTQLSNLAVNKFIQYRNGGLMVQNMTSFTSAFAGTITNYNSTISITDHLVNYASHSINVDYNPGVNNVRFTRAIGTRVNKLGAFNTSTVLGSDSQARNSGTGQVNKLIGHTSIAWAVSNAIVLDAWAYRANTQAQAGTVTNFGGLEVVFEESLAAATITNMYGIHVAMPVNTGATVTNTYGIRVRGNGEGADNWGLYMEGVATENYIEGNLSIGATKIVNSPFEVTGDIETIGSTKGLIVLDRTNGLRYRIYTDGGAIQVEAA